MKTLKTYKQLNESHHDIFDLKTEEIIKEIDDMDDVNDFQDKDGWNLLMLAILFNNSIVVDHLLNETDININHTNNFGSSALSIATAYNIKFLDILIQYDPIWEMFDRNDESFIDIHQHAYDFTFKHQERYEEYLIKKKQHMKAKDFNL